ncbi:MAG: hypothetical protein RR840_03600 [Clostridium sp.]
MDNLDKKISKMLNDEDTIPSEVRERIDATYSSIENKKTRRFPLKGVAAALVVASSVVMFSTTSFAEIKDFLGFKDHAISTAVENGFVEKGKVKVINNGVEIRLGSQTADKSKIAIEFETLFSDKTVIKDVNDIHIKYKVLDSKGKVVAGNLVDDNDGIKESLASIDYIVLGGECKITSKNEDSGVIKGTMLIDSNFGDLPKLTNHKIQIEKIYLIDNKNDKVKQIEGKWVLPLDLKESNTHINYKVVEATKGIKVKSITSTELATNIIFQLDREVEDESDLFGDNLYIIDSKGKRYDHNGCYLNRENGKSELAINFNLSSYDNVEEFKLITKKYGEVKFKK